MRKRGNSFVSAVVARVPGRIRLLRQRRVRAMGWREQQSAASPATWGAAADVPVNGRSRHSVEKGTWATKSGLGSGELGPHELYDRRLPSASTAPTAMTSGPSPGKGMLPSAVVW